METEVNGAEIGQQVGIQSAEATLLKVEAFCAYEKKRIELTNQAKIVALKAEFSLLLDEERELRELLRHAPPPGDLRVRRRKAVYYWVVALVLTAAALYFTLYTFGPFGVGSAAYLYCLGIAAAAPFLLGMALEKWNGGAFVKALTATACVAAVASLILLAVIRGDLLAQQLMNSDPVVVIDGAQSAPPPQTDFYNATLVLLKIVMALLAVAMDLGAGLALHEAWRMGSDSTENWGKLQQRLTELLERKVVLAFEVTALQDEPEIFANRFWSNFYRTILTHAMRSSMTTLFLVAIVFSLFFVGQAVAEPQLNLVIAVDLTQSVAVHALGQPSEFQKNIEAVSRLLAQVPASSRVTVIGITDQSFAQPDILLSAVVPDDSGYFGERLNTARKQLAQVWKTRSSALTPRFNHTDIIGALFVATHLFFEHASSQRRVLVIFSDMRNSSSGLSLDTSLDVALFSQALKQHGLPVPDLRHVDVYVLGVDAADKSIGDWQGLRDAWALYFKEARADLSAYSILRGIATINLLRSTTPDVSS